MQQEALKKNAAAFFAPTTDGDFSAPAAGQNMDDAAAVFYAVEQKKQGHQLGAPIPGYSGHNRRFEADNIFGTTYQGSRTNAVDSNNRIQFEKGETLKTTAKFMPSYNDARQQRAQFWEWTPTLALWLNFHPCLHLRK